MWLSISLLIIAATCWAAEPVPVPSALFFGDSICAGCTLPDGGVHDAWPLLWGRGNGGVFTIDNASKGGRPTASLGEFDAALAKAKACKLLVIALGANDARDLAADMTDKAVANLRAMLVRARQAAIPRIIILGPTNLNLDALQATKAIGPQRDANVRRLNAAYQTLAEAEKVEFLSMYGAVAATSLTADGVHPDKAGNEVLARRFAAYLAEHKP